MRGFYEDEEDIANNTFIQVISAIETQDISLLKNLFSKNVHGQIRDFDVQVTDFFEFVQGEIKSYDDAGKAGVGVDKKVKYGKRQKEIQSSFCVETSEGRYYIAIRECTEDTFAKDNIGVKSIYIINAETWKEDYVYRGDGEWKPGINIVQ